MLECCMTCLENISYTSWTWAAAVHIIIHTNFEGGFPPPLALCRKNLLQVAGSSLVMSITLTLHASRILSQFNSYAFIILIGIPSKD